MGNLRGRDVSFPFGVNLFFICIWRCEFLMTVKNFEQIVIYNGNCGRELGTVPFNMPEVDKMENFNGGDMGISDLCIERQ